MAEITVFPAGNGEAFLLSFPEEHFYILIDGGYGKTYSDYIKPVLKELGKQGERLNLIIATHVDSDHIGGLIRFLTENGSAGAPKIIPVDDIWYNGWQHTEKLEKSLGEEKKGQKEAGRKTAAGASESLIEAYLDEIMEYCRPDEEDEDLLEDEAADEYGWEENEPGESEINYKQGSTLAQTVYTGGYGWNKAFGGAAVMYRENQDVPVKLTENLSIRILNPSEEILRKAGKEWRTFWTSRSGNGQLPLSESGKRRMDAAFETYMGYIGADDGWEDDGEESGERDICETEQGISGKKGQSGKVTTREDIWKWASEELKEDDKIANLSSIAAEIDYKGKKIAFLGDMCAREGEKRQQEIRQPQKEGLQGKMAAGFAFLKMPHHGSGKSIDLAFLKSHPAENYLIVTDGKVHNHPDSETVAKILSLPFEKRIFLWDSLTGLAWLDSQKLQEEFQVRVEKMKGDEPFRIEIFGSAECKGKNDECN